MAFKAELCRTWVEERTGGADRYLTHVVTQTRTPQKVGHPGLTSSFAFSGADNASISELIIDGDRQVLRRFNDTAHLG